MELPMRLQKLTIGGFDALESIPERWMDFNNSRLKGLKNTSLSSVNYSFLERLKLENSCDSLQSFPLNIFPNLKSIKLNGCRNLESVNVPQQLELDLVALSIIKIKNYPNFVLFPNGGLRAPKHARFHVINCHSLTSLPDKMHILNLSLWELHLVQCLEVELFPEGGLPSSLFSIYIIDCDRLVANRRGWGLQNLPSTEHIRIKGNCADVESFPEASLLPTSLLRSMQEEGLPASISSLQIYQCALLGKQLQKKKGKAWRKIAHIPYKGLHAIWK
ncbi:hypothetical protein I3760_13G167100 [Carya illinoinensis]|nr:hypothetical protein I3760_13G167100 [Carya illinoinensis]